MKKHFSEEDLNGRSDAEIINLLNKQLLTITLLEEEVKNLERKIKKSKG